ncbi:MAG: hypothetical protein IIY69_04980, partial [Clostridia bacterium]|nr:hypothetical protein [Clostridia bacterium]
MRLSERFTLVEFDGRTKELDDICSVKKLSVDREKRRINMKLGFSCMYDTKALSELFGQIKETYRLSDISAEICGEVEKRDGDMPPWEEPAAEKPSADAPPAEEKAADMEKVVFGGVIDTP